MRKYFGTDGIRGKAGKYPISSDFFLKLGYAAGKVLTRHVANNKIPSVVIGKDTRVSGYMLESALEAGFSAAGVNVYLTGPIPTPAVAFLTKALRSEVGVVISASHNPFHDNGIKFFSHEGKKLDDQIEKEIESFLDSLKEIESTQIGKAKRIDDAQGRYAEFCKNSFPSNLSLDGLKIVLDCAHGATYQVAPKIFRELGAQLELIGVNPDGLNINHECGSTHLDALIQKTIKTGADIGIAFDGDGDRVIMVDRKGHKVDGDQLLYIIVSNDIDHDQFQGGVVGTLMTNLAFEEKLKSKNVPFLRAKVGDRYVTEMMNENAWNFGGENSGHILLSKIHSSGDGIITALQVLRTLQEKNISFEQAVSEIELYPQVLVNLPFKDIDLSSEQIKKSIDDANAVMNNQGRVLLRPSGTEPIIRIMTECQNFDLAEKANKLIQKAILENN
jgi:phosphoglucosamine mutase